MRTLNRCIPLALAAGFLAAQSLEAQEPTPRTHTVVRGDNLWDLSQKYLGNPFLWTEIYRLNRDVVEDPHWIYPGEVLRLPGEQGPAVSQLPTGPQTPVPTPPTPTTTAAPTPSGPLQTSVFRKIETPGIGGPGTSFEPGVVNAVPKPTVRAGEVIAAPYVDREGGPRGYGRILRSGDLNGLGQTSGKLRFLAYDRIFIVPPVGQVAPEGERYLTYRLGPVLDDQGQIVIPTGIVEVTKAARSGTAAVAKLVRAFGPVDTTNRLIPLDTTGLSTIIRPQAVANGPSTTIKWIYVEPELPSIQSFLVLGVSAGQGVRMGDEFLIYRPSRKGEDGEPSEPEIPISKAQVVRSTPYGATVVVVGVEQPAIKEGMPARVIARMP